MSYGLVEFLALNFKGSGKEIASFIFLPHGVRVISTLVFGPYRSFIYLFIAGSLIILLPNLGGELSISIQLLQCFVGALCAPLAFKLLEFSIGASLVYFQKLTFKSWRVLILSILFASLINAIGQTIVVELVEEITISMKLVLAYLIGDIIGAFLFIILLSFVLKNLKI